MLSYMRLKNHAGMMLTGDYWSLKSLHEILHDINERSPLVTDRDGPALGLAHDVRKAYECQREIIQPPKPAPEFGVRYGVKIIWPILLLQHQMLRQSLAFIDHGPRHQAAAYGLEAAIEDGLMDDFGSHVSNIKRSWKRINLQDPKVYDRLDSRGALFCSWSKAQRKRGLAELLDSFDPSFERWFQFRNEAGQKPLLSPSDFEAWKNLEWPDPKW